MKYTSTLIFIALMSISSVCINACNQLGIKGIQLNIVTGKSIDAGKD